MSETPNPTELLGLLEQAFSSVEEVCAELRDEEWDLPTDNPGWSVKDNLSHLASYEARANGGQAPPEIDVTNLPHVSGDALSVANEREVEARRGRTGPEVLEEFRDVTVERLKRLAALDAAEQGSHVSTYPFGESPTFGGLPIRILDVFYHEQDIRRATGRPGHLDGAVARLTFERLSGALPRIVAKNAGAPDGTVVVFETEPPGRTIVVEVAEGRGTIAARSDVQAPPTLRLRTDLETLLCLLGGRWTPDRARAEERLTVEGDQDLARRVLDGFVVIP